MLLPNRHRWDEPPRLRPSEPGGRWPDAIHDALTFRHTRLTTAAELRPLLAFYGLESGLAPSQGETLLAFPHTGWQRTARTRSFERRSRGRGPQKH